MKRLTLILWPAFCAISSAQSGQPFGYLPLQNGVAQVFVINPQNAGRFQITVPAGAISMRVRLEPQTANTDLDLAVSLSFNSPLTLATRDTAGESIELTTISNPPLRTGTYTFEVIRVSPSTPVEGRLTVTVAGAAATTPPPIVSLASLQIQPFTFPAVARATFFNETVYAFEVLPGATGLSMRLEVDRTGPSPQPTVQLYLRAAKPPELIGDAVAGDFTIFVPGNGLSTLTNRGGPVAPGTYFAALSVNGASGGPVTGRVTLSVTGGTAPPPRQLTSGQASQFSLAPVFLPTLLRQEAAYQITVPEGTAQLAIRTTTTTLGADVDLYLRYATPPALENGQVVRDAASVTENSGNETITLNAQSTPTLRPGIYYATLFLRSTGVAVEGTITATITAQPPPAPAITITGQPVNGASFVAEISPASWITLRGQNLSRTTRTWRSEDFAGNRLPKSLDGVSVQINGRDALIYYISPEQINALAPDDTASGSVPVTVTSQGLTARSTATLRRLAPAFFLISGGSSPSAAAVHLDGTLVGRPGLLGPNVTTRPARPGDRILLFATGFGPSVPSVAADELVPQALPLANTIILRLGDRDVSIEFAGLVSSGLYQFNIVIPTLAPGDHVLRATVANELSPANVILTVGANP